MICCYFPRPAVSEQGPGRVTLSSASYRKLHCDLSESKIGSQDGGGSSSPILGTVGTIGVKAAESVAVDVAVASSRRLGASRAIAAASPRAPPPPGLASKPRLAWFHSGREEVWLCSGPWRWEWRPIRPSFDSRPRQPNSDSGPNLTSFRAVPIRPDWASFRAVPNEA